MSSTRCSGLAKPDTISRFGKRIARKTIRLDRELQFVRLSTNTYTLSMFMFTFGNYVYVLLSIYTYKHINAFQRFRLSTSAINTKPKTNTSPTLPSPNPPKHWPYSQSATVSYSFGKLSIGNGFGYRTTPALGSARAFGKLFGFGFIAPQGEINPGIGNG
jgi:hypothetical protein